MAQPREPHAHELRALSAERRLHLLVDSIRDYAIVMLDPAGRIETWNLGAELLEGYTSDEVIGESIARFYPPEEMAAHVTKPVPLADLVHIVNQFCDRAA